MSDALTENLKKTPLFDLHLEKGGKMVPFAGYEMPVQYPLGVKKEHVHTREAAGIFDVSHMGQLLLSGDNADHFLETLVPVDVIDLPVGKQRYALFTNDNGGIIDDLMITRYDDCLYLVVNAACKTQDIEHIRATLPETINLEELTDRALIAIQGPKAADVLTRLVPDVSQMIFMDSRQITVDGALVFYQPLWLHWGRWFRNINS